METIKGLGTALVTPFKRGFVDFDALKNLIEYQISSNVDFIVAMGTTGESVTLSDTEIDQIVRFTVQTVNGRLPVVVGMGGNNTAALIEKMVNFNFDGVTAILSASPAYNKPSQDGIYHHYAKLAEVAPVPIIMYNVPGRTGSNISARTAVRLAYDFEKIVGIKEASGDMSQAAEILRTKPEEFVVVSGDDPTAMPLISLGGEGCISVISNAWPAEFSEVINYARQGDFKKARKNHLILHPLHHWLYIDGNPSGIKAALRIKGLCSDEVRLPLVGMSPSNFNQLEQTIIQVNKALAH